MSSYEKDILTKFLGVKPKPIDDEGFIFELEFYTGKINLYLWPAKKSVMIADWRAHEEGQELETIGGNVTYHDIRIEEDYQVYGNQYLMIACTGGHMCISKQEVGEYHIWFSMHGQK